MTESTHEPTPAAAPDDRREDPPAPAAAADAERGAPRTEAEREVRATIRSVSRLEESN